MSFTLTVVYTPVPDARLRDSLEETGSSLSLVSIAPLGHRCSGLWRNPKV